MGTEEFLEKVKVLDLKETDILVFTTDRLVPNHACRMIKKIIAHMGIKNKVLILDDGMDIKVLKDEDNIS